MEQALRGVIAPILTPFNDDLSIATDLYVAHAKHLLEEGCVGLAPFGTTGEALSLSSEERIGLLRALVAAGVDPDRLIPCTGLNNLAETVALSRACLEAGCKGLLVLPPFFYKGVSEDGLYAYFAALIEALDHPAPGIYLYHIPQISGVGFTIPLVRRLFGDFPGQVVGIKDSTGDWGNTSALLAIEGLTVYPGSEMPLIEALELGAEGCISATANLNAAGIAEVVSLFDGGKLDIAATRHAKNRAFRLAIQKHGPIPAQKKLLALRTGDERWANVRPPLDILPTTEGNALEETLDNLS